MSAPGTSGIAYVTTPEGDDEHHDDRARVTTVPVELVVRGSTGPPPS